jgi:ABC-2 type transport system ATP-binding protein
MNIEIRNVTKKINDAAVLDSVSLGFQSGKIYGIVGRNGSGKTMLLRAIAGLVIPTGGEVSVDGKILHRDIPYPPDMGILIDKPEFLNHLSGLDNLMFLAAIKKAAPRERIEGLMRLFDLDPRSKKAMRKYSQGMKQKIGIIQAVMEEQQLLVLDEATNALDEKSVDTFQGLLRQYRQEGRLIILTSHHKEDIESLCDVTYEIDGGRVR